MSAAADMIRKLIESAGGRGFIYALAFGFGTALVAQFGSMTWDQWVDFNKAVVYAFMGAKAIEGAAGAVGKKIGGGS